MRQWLGRASTITSLLLAGWFGGSACGGAKAPTASTETETEIVDAPAAVAEGVPLTSSEPSGTVPDSSEAETPVPKGPRLFAFDGYEKIYIRPDTSSPLIGLIRAGQNVPLEKTEALKGPGVGRCTGGFYSIKPRGFVCSGRHSTLDGSDPRVRAAAEILPDTNLPMPYRVGTVTSDTPQYGRIPTRAEQLEREPGLEAHLARNADTKKAGRGPTSAFMKYVESAKPELIADEKAYEGRKMSFIKELDAEGRTFLVTPDLTLVPKDKVELAEASNLQGVDLTKTPMAFPFGFTWTVDAPKLEKQPDGSYKETGAVYPRHTFVQLDGQVFRGQGGNYWKTADGSFIKHDLVTVFKQRKDKPAGVGDKGTWIDVRITWGTLVAYEGDKPVYATAISPGANGISKSGATTKNGQYVVNWKLISADMNGVDKKKVWAVDEVPFVLYYKDGYAVHGAWWHDDFGRPKSHGCVNVAPRDAQWLWRWMTPELPEGWYAVAAYPPKVNGTVIMIRP